MSVSTQGVSAQCLPMCVSASACKWLCTPNKASVTSWTHVKD